MRSDAHCSGLGPVVHGHKPQTTRGVVAEKQKQLCRHPPWLWSELRQHWHPLAHTRHSGISIHWLVQRPAADPVLTALIQRRLRVGVAVAVVVIG